VSVRFGPFVLHTDRRRLLRDGVDVHLTPKAFDLLSLLLARAPSVVPKAEVHAALWPDTFVSEATLAGLVKEVRRAVGDDGVGAVIRTVHRIGFAFEGAVAAPPAHATPDVARWLVVGARRMPLGEGVNVIGRDAAAAICLDVPGVSRRHAQIVVENGKATLEDLGSKNGTLIADRPVRGQVTLRNKDRIQVATELLIFHAAGRGASTATEPGQRRSHSPLPKRRR
jgi:DNA-binding winged helix-turn-helix (wHTH) protein